MICFSNLKPYIPPREYTLHLVLRMGGGGGPTAVMPHDIEAEEPEPTKVRQDFPETWIWDTIDGKK